MNSINDSERRRKNKIQLDDLSESPSKQFDDDDDDDKKEINFERENEKLSKISLFLH